MQDSFLIVPSSSGLAQSTTTRLPGGAQGTRKWGNGGRCYIIYINTRPGLTAALYQIM